MQYAAIGILVVIVSLGALVAYLRISSARAPQKLREEIRAYVTSKGGTVTFDDANGMTVEGPRGRGYQKLTTLEIMLSSAEDRNLTIGFALRKYLPDQFDEAFEKAAGQRLEQARGAIGALSPQELRDRVRVAVVSSRASSTGLATCSRPVVDGFESRVVLDGFELDGIPADTRARLPEDDAALFELALGRTLGDAPAFESGEVTGHAWLAAPSRLFGARNVIVAACGKKLAWTLATPDGASRVLADLASRSGETGPMKYVLVSWDGTTLERVPVTVHTVKGPTTPDFTLELSPALRAALALTGDERGSVGVSRA